MIAIPPWFVRGVMLGTCISRSPSAAAFAGWGKGDGLSAPTLLNGRDLVKEGIRRGLAGGLQGTDAKATTKDYCRGAEGTEKG